MNPSLSSALWRATLTVLSLACFAFAVWASTNGGQVMPSRAGTLAATFSDPEFGGAEGGAIYSLDATGNFEQQLSTLNDPPEIIDANDDVVMTSCTAPRWSTCMTGRTAGPANWRFQ